MTGTGATGHPTGQRGGEQRHGPPSPHLSPPLPPWLAGRGSTSPPPPPGPRGRPPSPRRDRDARGGTQLDLNAARPHAPRRLLPRGVATGGRARTSAPEQRTGHARGRHATTNRSSMGAAPPMTRASPMTPAMLPAQGGQRYGPGLFEPPGGRFTGRPPPPPPPPPARLARRRQAAPGARGCPATPTERVRQGGIRRRRKGGRVGSRRPPSPEREQGGKSATHPPVPPPPPTDPQATGAPAPTPPEAAD